MRPRVQPCVDWQKAVGQQGELLLHRGNNHDELYFPTPPTARRRTGFRRFPYRIRQGEDILPAILCSPVLTEGRVKNLAPAKHNLLTCRIH